MSARNVLKVALLGVILSTPVYAQYQGLGYSGPGGSVQVPTAGAQGSVLTSTGSGLTPTWSDNLSYTPGGLGVAPQGFYTSQTITGTPALGGTLSANFGIINNQFGPIGASPQLYGWFYEMKESSSAIVGNVETAQFENVFNTPTANGLDVSTVSSIGAAGTGGTNGACVVTLQGGTAVGIGAATFNVTISGGGITAVNSIASGGSYTALPSNPAGVTGCGLSGATLNLTWEGNANGYGALLAIGNYSSNDNGTAQYASGNAQLMNCTVSMKAGTTYFNATHCMELHDDINAGPSTNNATVSGTFSTGSPTVTLAATCPAGVTANMLVADDTIIANAPGAAYILGTVSTCSGTTLTLNANSLVANNTTADVLDIGGANALYRRIVNISAQNKNVHPGTVADGAISISSQAGAAPFMTGAYTVGGFLEGSANSAIVANSSWSAGATSITLQAATCPSNFRVGQGVNDTTASTGFIGFAQSCTPGANAVVALYSGALLASHGASDNLSFYQQTLSPSSDWGDDLTPETINNGLDLHQDNILGSLVKGANSQIMGDGTFDVGGPFSAAGTPIPTCNAAHKGGIVYVTDATSASGSYTSGGSTFAEEICNGSTWSGVGAASSGSPVITLGESNIPFIVAGSGSMANNGALTLTTALDSTYPVAYVLLPAGAIAAGVPAATTWYYAVFSSTTAATVYNNTYSSGTPAIPASPTAFSTTGPGAYTGVSAATAALSITVPGNTIGKNGRVKIEYLASFTGTTSTKSISGSYGALALGTTSISTAANLQEAGVLGFANQGATGAQVISNVTAGGYGTQNGAPSFGTVDSTASQTLSVKLTNTTPASNNLILQTAVAQLIPGI